MPGRGVAAARPLPDYETTPTSERGTTLASGWAGRGLRTRPSRRSSARASVRPSVCPSVSPSIPWSVLRAAGAAGAAGAGRAGVVLRLAKLPLAPAWAWASPTAPPGTVGAGAGRCRGHDAPPGARLAGLPGWPSLCVTPPQLAFPAAQGRGQGAQNDSR